VETGRAVETARADVIEGLVRGLAVIRAFSDRVPRHTPTTLARHLGWSRASARRFLVTLRHAGYAASDGREFWLTPKVLGLGETYLRADRLTRTVQPSLEELSRRLGESTTLGIIDGDDVVYLCKAQSTRLLSTSIGIGTRLPIQCSAAGWAIISTWSRPAIDAWLSAHPLKRYTSQTVTGVRAFRAALHRAALQGFVLLENQYEIGLRGLSVPLRTSGGDVVGAISVSSTLASSSATTAVAKCVPALTACAEELRSRL
jgi:IclR family transcriptional regulator, pca regulon regulatory protein